MLRLLISAVLLLVAPSAWASAAKEDKPEVGQYVDLSPVAMPIVVRGALVNYVFVYVRINLTGGANAVKLREKEPFFRDALIRAAHRTPFTKADDYTVVDAPRLQSTLMREAVALVGPNLIKSVVVTSQSPKKRMGLPKPVVAAARP